MTNSNTAKMTLEERLVQHIKDDKLSILVDDELAITEALFKGEQISSGYGRYEEKDSPVIAAAREVAKEAAQGIIQEQVDSLKGNVEFQNAIRSAIVTLLPGLILQATRDHIYNESHIHQEETLDRLKRAALIDSNTYV